MAINTLEMAKLYQKKLDERMIVDATSGWMEANATNVQYDGGDTVRKDYTLTKDRGRTFHLDAMDVNESNFIATAGAVMGEFQRAQVAPEIDAYRYSRIAALAKGASHESAAFTPSKDNILGKLDEEIAKIQDIVGESEPLVIIMPIPVRTILNNAKDVTRYLDVADFKAGEVSTKVKTYNEIPILSVPSDRMKTAYVFADGKTTGQEAGGFKPDTGAKSINWIIMARKAPIAISKTDKIRVFDPNTNQAADAWKLDYRKFHDIWIPSNKLAGVWVNTGA